MPKTTQHPKALKCPLCGRRVAKNWDNYCHITEEYIHTKCWVKLGPQKLRARRVIK